MRPTATADIEARRRVLQDQLDRLKTPEERNRLGQFATPNSLALAIASQARQLWGGRGPVRFLDPSIGTGSFYSALRQVFPADMIAAAAGVEVDPAFAAAAADLWGSLGLQVTHGDFTRLTPPRPDERFNLILTNPPYVRHHHLDREDKQRLKALVGDRLGTEISGLAGVYAHVLLLADAWLEEGGLAFWLIPSEFMDVNYGAAVKDYLTRRVRLLQIHRFQPTDVQFCDALVTSTVVIFEKADPRPGGAVRFSLGGLLDRPEASELVPLETLRLARKWTSDPRAERGPGPGDARRTTLGDLFTIRRGLATGANGFFILPRAEAERRGLPPAFLRPILPSPRHLADTIIEADTDGYPRIARPLALLDCDLPEETVRRDHPALWAYLQEGVARGLNAGYLTSRRAPWYAQERREPPPFLVTYMGRTRGERGPFRVIWNRSRAVAANVYLLLYPKGPLMRAIQAQPEVQSTVFAFLRSIDPSEMVGEGRVYGGGLHKMEPKELAALSAEALLAAAGRGTERSQTRPDC
jgi:predicted RNA methylase